MQTKLLKCVLVTAMLMAAGIASGADSYIQCPVRSIETNVTTSLPNGWWSTPQGGNLTDTEIVSMGGRPKLMCVYKMPSSEVSVMRDAPAGMGCTASGSGFKCQDAVQQGASNSSSSKSIDVPGQTRADTPVMEQADKTLTPGNVKHDSGPQVRTKGSCPDLTFTGVEVKMLSRDPQGQYFFRLAARLENRGRADFTSAAGQQVVEIHQVPQGGSSRRLGEFAFRNVSAGADGPEATYDVLRWRTSQEFPPSYRFTIVFGPDIGADNNPGNDDCTLKNNSTTITGDDINSIIRGSGI